MATIKEEKAAFEKLKKAFPDRDSSLIHNYHSWKKGSFYHATINDLGSTYGTDSETADEAVNLMIKMKEVQDGL